MIPVSFLYDEYIDRPKLTEQKKNPVEYIVPPPPLKRGRNKNNEHDKTRKLTKNPQAQNVQFIKSLAANENLLKKVNYISIENQCDLSSMKLCVQTKRTEYPHNSKIHNQVWTQECVKVAYTNSHRLKQ